MAAGGAGCVAFAPWDFTLDLTAAFSTYDVGSLVGGPVGVETATRPTSCERNNDSHSLALSSCDPAMAHHLRIPLSGPSTVSGHGRTGQGIWSRSQGHCALSSRTSRVAR